MKKLMIILFLASVCFGDTYTTHQKPNMDSALDLGTNTLLWRYIFGDSFTDGTALWDSSNLSGFIDISAVDGTFSGTLTGSILTDGIFIATGGVVTAGTWQGTVIDISDYTNLVAGTNITLAGDTLNIDNIFLVNTVITDILIVGSNPPATITSPGVAGTITYDADFLYVAIANNSWKRVALTIVGWGVAGDTMIYQDDNTMVFENGDTMIYN